MPSAFFGDTPATLGGQGSTVREFRDMLGMCAHAQWINEPGTVYDPLSDWMHVVDLAASAGISWHRTGLPVGQAWFRDALYAKHQYTVSKGLKLTLEIDGYWATAQDWYGTPEAQMNWISSHFNPSDIIAFEAPNEPDNFHPENGNWPALLVDWMVRMKTAIRAHPEFDSIPILGPSLCFNTAYPLGQAFQAKGVDPKSVMDYWNPHPYDGGDKPKLSHMQDEKLKYQPLGSDTLPGWPTEWGYFTSVPPTTYAPVDETTHAVYTMKGFATQFLFGFRRSSFYVVLDTNTADRTNAEYNFGWWHSDYSPKPTAVAMQNLMGFLGPKEEPATPGRRPYTITGGPSDLRHFQVQRADGSHVIFVWQERIVWNRDNRTTVVVPPVDVTVTIPGANLGAYNPRTNTLIGTSGTFPVDGDLWLVDVR